jgi:signal transduction histidine kinase
VKVPAWMGRLGARPEAEIALASVAAVAAFAVAAVISAASRSHVPGALLGVGLILGVVAVARLAGIVYALPAGVATVEAFDWYFLPPLRVVDRATVLILAFFIVMSVLVAYIATGTARRAKASEAARGALAEEQAALRRVATLVARQASPQEVFAAVTEEVGRLLNFEGVILLSYGDGMATVVASWNRRGRELTVGTQLALEGDSVANLVFRTQRPARVDDYANAEGSTAAFVRSLEIRTAVGTPVVVEGRVWGVMTGGSLLPRSLPDGTEARIEAFTQLVATAISNAEARTELEQLAAEQAALRRVATLVARGMQPGEVFAAVAEEIARVLDVGDTSVVRFEADATATIVAKWGANDLSPVDSNWSLEGDSVTARVFHSGRSARIDSFAEVPGELAELARRLGRHSAVGAPIVVDDRLWGAAVANTRSAELPPSAEGRLANFADLIATAVSNMETRTELTASRARVVAAADETRRRLERDLHDGIQQRLVSLALELRTAESMVHQPSDELTAQLAGIAAGLTGSLDELREISRGIHPAILSEGGLEPALRALARRSAIPVRLDVDVESRLDEPVEVAAYYVASEAFANAAKHARASVLELQMNRRDGCLVLSIRDDGVGGADPRRGSGLVGLIDRVEALGGTISVASPAGDGTSLQVKIPLD